MKINNKILSLKANRKQILLLTLLILTFLSTDTSFATDFRRIDTAGNNILNTVRHLGYWIILTKAVCDVIGQGLRGDLHGIGKTIMLYVILYGALFFIPYALKLVEGVF